MGLGCQSESKVVPNGSPGNYCKVSNEHIIGHVLVGQNEGLHPQWNVFVEQINRILLDRAQCMLSNTGLSKDF